MERFRGHRTRHAIHPGTAARSAKGTPATLRRGDDRAAAHGAAGVVGGHWRGTNRRCTRQATPRRERAWMTSDNGGLHGGFSPMGTPNSGRHHGQAQRGALGISPPGGSRSTRHGRHRRPAGPTGCANCTAEAPVPTTATFLPVRPARGPIARSGTPRPGISRFRESPGQREVRAPLRLRVEREGVHRSGDVAATSRVSVLAPGPAHPICLLQHHIVGDPRLLQLDGSSDPGESGAHHHQSEVRRLVAGCDGHRRVGGRSHRISRMFDVSSNNGYLLCQCTLRR